MSVLQRSGRELLVVCVCVGLISTHLVGAAPPANYIGHIPVRVVESEFLTPVPTMSVPVMPELSHILLAESPPSPWLFDESEEVPELLLGISTTALVSSERRRGDGWFDLYAAVDAVNNAANAAVDGAFAAANAVVNATADAANVVVNATVDAANAVVNATADAANAVVNATADVVNAAANAAANVVNATAGAVNAAANAVAVAYNAAVDVTWAGLNTAMATATYLAGATAFVVTEVAHALAVTATSVGALATVVGAATAWVSQDTSVLTIVLAATTAFTPEAIPAAALAASAYLTPAGPYVVATAFTICPQTQASVGFTLFLAAGLNNYLQAETPTWEAATWAAAANTWAAALATSATFDYAANAAVQTWAWANAWWAQGVTQTAVPATLAAAAVDANVAVAVAEVDAAAATLNTQLPAVMAPEGADYMTEMSRSTPFMDWKRATMLAFELDAPTRLMSF